MTAIGQLKSASHGGISFPYSECRVRLTQRKHVHVFLHTPGGEVEKFGRSLYEIGFTIPAHDSLLPPYANFYSTKLPQLWALWESSATAPLVVPSLGTLQGFNTEATRTIRGNVASGEPIDVSFIEDQQALFALSALFRPSTDGLAPLLTRFLALAQGLVEPSLLDQLTAAIDALIRLRSLGEVIANVVSAKIAGAIYTLERLGVVNQLGLPGNYPALDALLDLHGAVLGIRDDVQRRSRATNVKVTPARMSLVQLAVWVHGDASRANELLMINGFADPFNIPRGTAVKYYE